MKSKYTPDQRRFEQENDLVERILINCTGRTLEKDSDKRVFHFKLEEGAHIYCIIGEHSRQNHRIVVDDIIQNKIGGISEKSVYPSVILIRNGPFEDINKLNRGSITSGESCFWSLNTTEDVSKIGYNIGGIIEGEIIGKDNTEEKGAYKTKIGRQTDLGVKYADVEEDDELSAVIMREIIKTRDLSFSEKERCILEVIKLFVALDKCRYPWNAVMTGSFTQEKMAQYAQICAGLKDIIRDEKTEEMLITLIGGQVNARGNEGKESGK